MITIPFSKKKKKGEEKTNRKPDKKGKDKEIKRKKKIKKELGKSDVAFKSLKSPVISEKATILEEKGKYVFKVFPKTSKNEIKKSVEDIYNVKVEKVNVLNVRRKRKKVGKTEGWKSGYKKAIVSLRKGDKIELISR